jgi:hypothetical protein
MALPKLNSEPKYELIIPSLKKKVKFRPFLVKEEKVLMIAMESGEQKDALNAILDTISVCIQEKIDLNTLTTFDVEYLFLQLRAKSVGETAKVNIKCTHCDTPNTISIKLDDINIELPEIENTVKLDEKVSVELQWPPFKGLTEIDAKNSTESAFEMIANCIKVIYTEDERINVSEVSKPELIEFLESMNSEQFSKLRDYIDKLPKLKHDVAFSCKNCATSNNITLEGVESFLS